MRPVELHSCCSRKQDLFAKRVDGAFDVSTHLTADAQVDPATVARLGALGAAHSQHLTARPATRAVKFKRCSAKSAKSKSIGLLTRDMDSSRSCVVILCVVCVL